MYQCYYNAWLFGACSTQSFLHLKFLFISGCIINEFPLSVMTSVNTGFHLLYQMLLLSSPDDDNRCKPYLEFSGKCEGTIIHFLAMLNLPSKSLQHTCKTRYLLQGPNFSGGCEDFHVDSIPVSTEYQWEDRQGP